MEQRAMELGMRVRVLPARRGVRHPSYGAEVVALPDRPRGRAKVKFGGGQTAWVRLDRLVKP